MDQEELNEVRRLLTWLEVSIESIAFIGVLALIAAIVLKVR